MKIGIVILHFGTFQTTLKCLKSLVSLEIPNNVSIHPYLIDNSGSLSKDDVPPKIDLIRNQDNLGYAAGNNVGIKKAIDDGCDYVWIINNDIILDKKCLVEILNLIAEYKDALMIGPKIYFAKGYEFHKERYKPADLGKVIWWAGGSIDWNNVYVIHHGVDEVDVGQFDQAGETETITGAALMIKSEVFKKIGFLNEKYYLYFEETEFCQRARIHEIKRYFCPKAVVWHLNSGSSGSGSSLHDYYLTRNRLFFGMSYAPLRTKFALFRESLTHLIKGRKWQRRGVLDFFLGISGKGSYPIGK